MVEQIKDARHRRPATPAFQSPSGRPRAAAWWNGERLFQAARFVDRDAVPAPRVRGVRPQDPAAGERLRRLRRHDIDPAITAEFAHTVYRFGHSMLTETVRPHQRRRLGERHRADRGLPQPAGLRRRRQRGRAHRRRGGRRGRARHDPPGGNEIDEFVTEALRNNLLGLPLDLAALNMARGRDTGVPTAQRRAPAVLRADDATRRCEPYDELDRLRLGLRNPESLINFIAAYGTHPTITGESGFRAKRAAAEAIVTDQPVVLGSQTFDPPTDRRDFLNGLRRLGERRRGASPTPASTTSTSGSAAWPRSTMPFGGMLGSTFNYVFETQMEAPAGRRPLLLPEPPRRPELPRPQLEGNSFAELVIAQHRRHAPAGRRLLAPGLHHRAARRPRSTWCRPGRPVDGRGRVRASTRSPAAATPCASSAASTCVMGGTAGDDQMRADEGDDTYWGDGGNDRLEGGDGNDQLDRRRRRRHHHRHLRRRRHQGRRRQRRDQRRARPRPDPRRARQGLHHARRRPHGDLRRHRRRLHPRRRLGRHDVFGGRRATTGSRAATQADLLQGDNGDPFQNDTVAGDDVIDRRQRQRRLRRRGRRRHHGQRPRAPSATTACSASTGSTNKGDAQPGDDRPQLGGSPSAGRGRGPRPLRPGRGRCPAGARTTSCAATAAPPTAVRAPRAPWSGTS